MEDLLNKMAAICIDKTDSKPKRAKNNKTSKVDKLGNSRSSGNLGRSDNSSNSGNSGNSGSAGDFNISSDSYQRTKLPAAVPKNPRSFYISKQNKHEVRQRANDQCQYVDLQSKRRCEAKMYLQFEHKIPRAKGGTSDLENLEILCAAHNRLRAIEEFGGEKMKNYLS
jgi:hypothetical protein